MQPEKVFSSIRNQLNDIPIMQTVGDARYGRIPALSFLLAYLAMVPVAGTSVLVVCLPRIFLQPLDRIDSLWCGALLCFFAGVRRGLSFRQRGGPTLAQLAGMMWLFFLGIFTLLLAGRAESILLALAGFASIIPLDNAASRHDEAPHYFAWLRQLQMWVPLVSLSIMFCKMVG